MIARWFPSRRHGFPTAGRGPCGWLMRFPPSFSEVPTCLWLFCFIKHCRMFFGWTSWDPCFMQLGWGPHKCYGQQPASVSTLAHISVFFERKCPHKKWEDPSSTDSFYFVARSVKEDHESTLLELQYLVWRLYGYGQNHGSVLGFIWCYTEIAVKSISHWYEKKQTYFHCWRPHFDWWNPCLLLLINYLIHNLSTFLLKTPVPSGSVIPNQDATMNLWLPFETQRCLVSEQPIAFCPCQQFDCLPEKTAHKRLTMNQSFMMFHEKDEAGQGEMLVVNSEFHFARFVATCCVQDILMSFASSRLFCTRHQSLEQESAVDTTCRGSKVG